jgi:hypothetical protein
MTELRKLLDIELPILQAPMAGVQGSALAIAVSNAGGLGALPCAMLDVHAVRAEVAAIRAQTTKPFNVNFFCHAQPEPSAQREALWREALSPYFDELGVDPSAIPAGPGRAPFSDELAELVEALKPPVVSFHFGLPPERLLDRVRACGAKILSSATTVDEARWLEARGVDAIIAQGVEAGGHRGHFLSNDLNAQLGTFALVPQVVDAVSVPVIAAGGIADARGVAARGTGGHGILAVPRGDDDRAASFRAAERSRSLHGAHERVHRAARPRHRQSHHARARADERCCAALPARRRGHGAAPSQGRGAAQDRLLSAVGRTERVRVPGDLGGRPYARARGQPCSVVSLIRTRR